MNHISLIGRICYGPSSKAVSTGQLVSFGLAVRRFGKDAGADFFDCKIWNEKTGNIVMQYLSKGAQVGVEGRVRIDSFEQDGKTIKKTEVNVSQVHLIGSAQHTENNVPQQQVNYSAYEQGKSFDDEPNELPF